MPQKGCITNSSGHCRQQVAVQTPTHAIKNNNGLKSCVPPCRKPNVVLTFPCVWFERNHTRF